MGSIAEHKLHLIQQISAIDDPKDLELLERELEKIKAEKQNSAQESTVVRKGGLTEMEKKLLAKPIRKTFDKEAMMREQGWTGKHDKEGMDRLIKEMDIQEPIEELLAMLTK
jgi:hypothetical protein